MEKDGMENYAQMMIIFHMKSKMEKENILN